MHKAVFFEGTLHFTLHPDGPLLIKAGESGSVDPSLPDMQFVRTQGDVIYIPGPSLKGVVRAQAERICRSLDSDALQQHRQRRRGENEPRVPLADNPVGSGYDYNGLQDMEYNSGRAIEAMNLNEKEPARTAIVYRRSSLVSQMFGHTSLAGRIRFADAMPTGALLVEERNGVAIDRIYGSVAVGPFNYEVVVGGAFSSRIDFKNLTLAQLCLLGLSLRDVAEGRVGVGFGKSRGLGRVRLTFDRLDMRYPSCELIDGREVRLFGRQNAICTSDQFVGLEAFPVGDEYHLPENEPAPMPTGLRYSQEDILGVSLTAADDAQVRSVWKACIGAWKRELSV